MAAAEVSNLDPGDMALQVEDIVEGEAEVTTAVVAGAAGAAEAAGAAVAAEDTTAATRAEEDGAVPAASKNTKIAPRPRDGSVYITM